MPKSQEDQDWGFVAMVLDRLFLWIFAIASLVGTVMILCEAPALYDDTKPIDMELSSVARQMLMPNNHLDNLMPHWRELHTSPTVPQDSYKYIDASHFGIERPYTGEKFCFRFSNMYAEMIAQSNSNVDIYIFVGERTNSITNWSQSKP